MKKAGIVIVFFAVCCVVLFIVFFGPLQLEQKTGVFTVPEKVQKFDMAGELKRAKYIKNEQAFNLLVRLLAPSTKPNPGGYYLSPSMNALDVLKKINGKPDLVWVSFKACLRKEQIGEILADKLGWNDEILEKWNTVDTEIKPEYAEGVYYPDTYLIPVDEPGDKIAKRLINRFDEKFSPLADDFIAGNIKWTTGLKIASLIAREAAGKEDMKLISGVIWNRLDIGMPLQIDATMQYTKGKNNKGLWWGSIDIKEKLKDSPYNTYLYKGLPPGPICSPNIEYMEAVLYPEETECLYYLHDGKQQIHCAKTYEEHLENIELYLN